MSLIDKRIKNRAYKAFKFFPFNKRFYFELLNKGLSSKSVFENPNIYCLNGCSWFKDSESVENSFRWLIKVGILRREVDGQGLTSRIRLTPLARQLLEVNPQVVYQKVNFLERTFICSLIKFQL
tara:strand:- start:891 stop:1262 length:372 start_codon:yes stop_codon:yes gene_type:complete